MKHRKELLVILFLPVLLFIGMTLPAADVNAAPDLQGFVTATPGPDGRILYTVISGDNCSSIAFAHGITVPQLRQFNTRLDDDCTLTIGQQLVVGLPAPITAPTAAAPVTPTLPAVTATPFDGTTEVASPVRRCQRRRTPPGDRVRRRWRRGQPYEPERLLLQTQNTTSAIDPYLVEPIRSCFLDPAGEIQYQHGSP